jgi:putative ABC transport system permease protein
VAAVLVFDGVSESFTRLMVGQVTDSMLSHLQVHRRGYVASIDSLPLTMNLPAKPYEKAAQALTAEPDVAVFSPRLKLGARLSNFEITTAIRLNGVDPAKEEAAVPDLKPRVKDKARQDKPLVERNQILVPEVLANGLGLKVGQPVVVATNRDGSVNGLNLTVVGIVEIALGRSGRDGYMHLEDAAALLRLSEPEVSEIAVRLKDFSKLDEVAGRLEASLGGLKSSTGRPLYEIHTWAALSPFANIVRLIDVMTVSIKVILIAVILISILPRVKDLR